MRATATKNRGPARKTVKRRPSATSIAAIEKTVAQLPDLTSQRPQLPEGMMFDSEITTYRAEATVMSGPVDGDRYDVNVVLEIGADVERDYRPTNAAILVTFGRYLLYPGETNRTSTQETETIEIHMQELEPFALALTRALQLAKVRGFLPTVPA